MPKTIYSDFDEFADAINGVAGRIAATGRSESDWWVHCAPIGSLVIQQLQTGGPAAFVGEGKENTITIGVPASRPGEIRVDGRSLENNAFILVSEHQPFAVGGPAPMRWSGITIPIDHPDLPPAVLDPKASRRKRETYSQAEERAVQQAKSLVLRLLSEEARIDQLEGAAAQGAEEALVFAASRIIEGIRHEQMVRVGRPAYSRGHVLAKALETIETQQGKPLFLQDLCRATQVSERTLRNIFHEYFGIGPMRLLKINRLREIRAALMTPDVYGDCVWKIAARFGVWDLSAFASDYKALFGELPHQTLRATARLPRRVSTSNATWVRYASRKLMEAAETRA